MNQFSQNLRKLRLEEHLTQREFAKKVHLSNAVVSKYEGGLSCPSMDSLIEMANYFHVSVDYLVGNDQSKSAEPFSHLTPEQRDTLRVLERFFSAENAKKGAHQK